MILDHRGRLVARGPGAAPAGRRLAERPLVKTVLREHQGTAEVTGLDGVLHDLRLRAGGWKRGRPPLHQARAAPRRASSRTRTTTCAATCCSRASASWRRLLVSYVMTATCCSGAGAPKVVESARRFGAGDLTARAPVPRGLGELTDVANALQRSCPGHPSSGEAAQTRLLSGARGGRGGDPAAGSRRTSTTTRRRRWLPPACASTRWPSELNDPAEREAVLKARTALIEANRRLRRLLFELRPPALDEAGLGAALELFLTDSFAHDGFDWRVENRLEDPEPGAGGSRDPLPGALEALTNVRKHAKRAAWSRCCSSAAAWGDA